MAGILFCANRRIHTVMMIFCPHCGHLLPSPLVEGISSCTNCRRCCDSTRQNKLLSLAWVVRKHNISEADHLVYRYSVSREDAEFVLKYVDVECYSHEEFYHVLKELNLKDYPERQLDRAS
jgi:DNA-directed RNA polymerase subunit M/transcription elongation factor TFIIS